jgi:hypothetical protein
MYLIEEISSNTLLDFQNKLNAFYKGGFEIIQIIYYEKGGFNKLNKATILFRKHNFNKKISK